MKQAKLKDLFDYLPKSKVQAGDGLEEGIYPFYTSSENQTKYLNEYQQGPGCLVFGTGGKASVHLTTRYFSTSTDCITIKPKPEVAIDAGYVFQYFKANMKVLESGFKGAGLKHISKAYLSDIQVTYPEELDDQRRIAHLLGNVERLVDQRKQQLQQLDELLKSVFLEMFGDPVRNEKGWKKPPLVDLTHFITDGKHGDCSNAESSGYYFISAKDIHDGIIDYSKARQIKKDEFEEVHRRTDLQPYDLVMVNTGATIGKMAIAQPDPKTSRTTFQKSVAVIKPIHEELNVAYLKALFEIRLRALIRVSSGSAQQNLLLSQMRKIPVMFPPIELQNQFAAIVEKLGGIKSSYQQSRTKLEALYSALGQKTFKGELDLSRVPLPPDSTEGEQTMAIATFPTQAVEVAIHLPDTDILPAALEVTEMRGQLLTQWLEAYRTQLGDATFSVQRFMVTAQTRLAELHPDIDFELSVTDYEHTKKWVFEALRTGKLAQAMDDAGNRIQLKAAQA